MIASLSTVVMLAGCSNKVTTINKESSNNLVFANFRDLRDLNPHLYNGEMFAQNLIFESLVKIADDGSFEPWLAESWEILDDGTTYVFKLREDVSFTDGVKFNAEAAKANFDAILDEFDRIIGLDRLLVVHLNDSKNVQGAHKDRHANLGLGEIGFDILNGIAHNERIKDVPKILETPYIDGKAPYKEEIDMLKNQEFRNIEV